MKKDSNLNRLIFIPILLLFLSSSSYAQEPLPKEGSLETGLTKVTKGYFDGLIDNTGKVVVSPDKYYKIEKFTNGYAAVSIDPLVKQMWDNEESWGIIDKTGKEVIPTKYLKQDVLNMIADTTLLQKEMQHGQEQEMLIKEAETALDNNFYGANCPSVAVLEKLRTQLKQMEKELPSGLENMEKRTYLLKLQSALSNAISTQLMTKKYGVTTAKKIMAGNYEIGMTKAVAEEILGVNKVFYKKSITTQSETWQFDWNNPGLSRLSSQDRFNIRSKCPKLVFRGGKLAEISK
jgi:hypothetical protein